MEANLTTGNMNHSLSGWDTARPHTVGRKMSPHLWVGSDLGAGGGTGGREKGDIRLVCKNTGL